MRKFARFFVILIPVFALSYQLSAQNNFFTSAREADIPAARGQRLIIPDAYKLASLDATGMQHFLWSLPTEQKVKENTGTPEIITLPMPDGKTARFKIWESSIMAPELAAKFPGIKTFGGQGIDDPTATIRLDWTVRGFHAMILSDLTGNVFIDPYRQADTDNYTIYYKKDLAYHKNFFEYPIPETIPVPGNTQARELAGPCVGTALRTYRLALACTNEYAAAVCAPNPPDATTTFSAMTTSMNRVNGVYEKEVSVRMVFVANESALIYLTDPDPYTNDNGNTMLGENTTNINSIIGFNNYDIGHVFSTGGGGVATVGGPCGTTKARGVTGLPNPTGDAFDIDFVAHEMGHQFGASHTFNATTGNCGGSNRTGSTAMEPGSGITIMGYAGICGSSNNLSAHSIATFHGVSFDQISSFVANPASGGSCPVVTPVVNNIPVVNAGSNFTIPRSTSFVLTGSATDADPADVLSYSWEEMDAGPAGNWDAPTGNAPLFRSFLPVAVPERNFPKLQDQINNTTTIGEILPSYGRTMTFRLTARDNHAGGGGVCFSEMQVAVDGASGPFVVSSPSSTGISWPANSAQTVTWNVANTNNAPVSCTNVSILLSTDGGLTFPITIVASTPNDGTENITVPGNITATARIRVKAVGNIFYDISDNNFAITAATTGFGFNIPAAANVACAGPASSAITLGVTSIAGFVDPVTLTATGLPAGTNVVFTPNPVIPGNNTTVTLNNVNLLPNGTYNITVTGTSGALQATRQLTYNVQVGTGPAVTTHPQPQQACAGTNAVFTVVAPAGISYQWQESTNGGTSFADIVGATTATLTLPPVTTLQNNYQYRVIVRGQCNTTTSNAALLTVTTPPFVSTQPQNTSRCVNSNAIFTVVGGGSNLTYQWQVSTNGGTSFTDIPLATTSTLTVSTLTTAMNNNQYRVIISGSCTPAATSNAATLTVISPATVTSNPSDNTICESGSVNFTVAGTSSVPLIYQWQVSADGGTSYMTLSNDNTYSGVNSATLTLTGVTATMNNNLYRALLSNGICTVGASTSGALLKVNARPTVTLTAPLVNLLPGQSTLITASIQPAATGFDITWFRNNVLIPVVTGTTYLVDSVETGEYRVKIVNQTTGCNNESNALVIGANASTQLFIFPNPNNGQFTVSYFNSAGTTSQQTVRVYDDHGQLVYNAKITVSGPYTLHTVNLKQVARGVYLVIIGDAGGRRLAKGKVVIH